MADLFSLGSLASPASTSVSQSIITLNNTDTAALLLRHCSHISWTTPLPVAYCSHTCRIRAYSVSSACPLQLLISACPPHITHHPTPAYPISSIRTQLPAQPTIRQQSRPCSASRPGPGDHHGSITFRHAAHHSSATWHRAPARNHSEDPRFSQPPGHPGLAINRLHSCRRQRLEWPHRDHPDRLRPPGPPIPFDGTQWPAAD